MVAASVRYSGLSRWNRGGGENVNVNLTTHFKVGRPTSATFSRVSSRHDATVGRIVARGAPSFLLLIREFLLLLE